jgi:uncharacterized protein
MIFLLAFFTVYLFMHAFTWSRFCAQLGLGRKSAMTGYSACVFLTLTPVISHMLPVAWPRWLVYAFWQATFTWLALIFYLLMFQLLILVIQTLLWPLIRPVWPVIAPRAAYFAAGAGLLVVGYGFFEASRPVRVTEYEFESAKISRDLSLIFLSDLHLGVQKSSARLKDIIDQIEKQKSDLIIFGGDLVNDNLEWLEDEAQQLNSLYAPLGKYGVLGNHEFYPGIDKSLELFRQSGITLLDNKAQDLDLNLNLTLTGVSDPTPFPDQRKRQEEVTRGLLQGIDTGRFNLLISHRPWGFEQAAAAGVDLHLAGHTHNGQIFPFRYFIRLQFDYIYGYYEKAGSGLMVTSGAGSWGPPIRVLAPAEIVLVKISRRDKSH